MFVLNLEVMEHAPYIFSYHSIHLSLNLYLQLIYDTLTCDCSCVKLQDILTVNCKC